MLTQVSDPIIMTVKQTGDVRIHTFVASFAYSNIANATHIIETKNQLVLVDGQFLAPYARAFRDYADSLGKPIERLYVSHRHPDHWFGLGTAFTDITVYALSETMTFIHEHGEDSRSDHWKLGDLTPERIVVPKQVASPGEETIDGTRYVFDRVTDTEIDYDLTIRLPEIGVYFAQDLIYSGTHLYLTKHMDHWIQVLQEMLVSDYELFMLGHGLPARQERSRPQHRVPFRRPAGDRQRADKRHLQEFHAAAVSGTQVPGDLRHIHAPAVRRRERLLTTEVIQP